MEQAAFDFQKAEADEVDDDRKDDVDMSTEPDAEFVLFSLWLYVPAQTDAVCSVCSVCSVRALHASPVYLVTNPKDNAALPGLLASLIQKMVLSPRDPVKELDANRPYILVNEATWVWKRVKWLARRKLNRHKWSANATQFILLQDLGFGKDGRVWKAATLAGLCVVIKFAHLLDKVPKNADYAKLKTAAEQRLRAECARYEQTNDRARIATLGSHLALILPYYSDVDFSDRGHVELVRIANARLVKDHRLLPKDNERRHWKIESPAKKGGKSRAVAIDRVDFEDVPADADLDAVLASALKPLKLDI